MTRLVLRFLAIAGFIFALCGIVSAQIVEEAFPIEPKDGTIVGTRPRFRIGLAGDELEDVRFRIVFSRDDFDTEEYVFDQVENRNGWIIDMFSDRYGAIYRPARPLEDGTYNWRVDAWDGIRWVRGDSYFRIHIDGTPPAPVERVRMAFEENGSVRLRWDPVSHDEKGSPEYVSKYHIYRSERSGPFIMNRITEVGTTELNEFIDETAPQPGDLIFYRVIAEDEAGNHQTGKFEPTDPEK